jgi:hypothetical protein
VTVCVGLCWCVLVCVGGCWYALCVGVCATQHTSTHQHTRAQSHTHPRTPPHTGTYQHTPTHTNTHQHTPTYTRRIESEASFESMLNLKTIPLCTVLGRVLVQSLKRPYQGRCLVCVFAGVRVGHCGVYDCV